MDIPEIADARRLRLRPGDVLALRLDCELYEGDADEIRARVREVFGWPVPVMILEPGAEIGVIGPAGDPESDAEALIGALRQYIRSHGGSVQSVLGGA